MQLKLTIWCFSFYIIFSIIYTFILGTYIISKDHLGMYTALAKDDFDTS